MTCLFCGEYVTNFKVGLFKLSNFSLNDILSVLSFHISEDGLTRRLWRGVEQNLDLAMASRLTQKMSLREAMDEATSQRLQ